MGWIGSPSQQPQVVWVWHTTPFKTFADLQSTKAVFGSTSPSADNHILPTLLNRLMDTRIEIVTGYQAVNAIFLAVERGELQGNSTPLSSITIGKPAEYKEGKIRVLAQFGSKRLPELASVPTGIELAKTDLTRRVLDLYGLKFAAAYPFMLPPEVPAERVAALQKAFDDTMKDPEFLAEAGKVQLEIEPLSAREIDALLANAFATPKAIVREAAELIEPTAQK
jgi:tripartite-type tricarboxylate transporter receptor subunit TctC